MRPAQWPRWRSCLGLRSRAMARRKEVPPMTASVPELCPQCHSPVAERFPHAVMYDCGFSLFNDGKPVTDDYPEECQRRRIKRLEKQLAARAEAERRRKKYEEMREGMNVANRVRFYLRRVTDYAMHDLEPVRYMHIEAEVPALAEILRREQKYPWYVVGVELVEERDFEGGGG